MRQTDKQTGSLLGYLLVAGVLTALLVGGLFWVQRYKIAVDAPEIVATQDEKNNNTKKDPAAATDKKNDSAEDKAAEKATLAPEPPKETAATGSGSASNSQVASGASSASELPTTGPEETILSLFVLAALAYAVTIYTRSRRI